MSDVKQSLKKYLEEELLTGENKYFCNKCNEKVDAKKGVCIRTLPPLLIFSLSRFDFDLIKGTRNKINSRFEYPETIDLKEFLEKNENNEKLQSCDTTYDLFSVIIHVGSAHQGHYHAYIKDLQSEGKCFDDQFTGKKKRK